jgi:hypothetical protein
MSLPGFNAEAALYRPTRHYTGTYRADFNSDVVPAALPGFEACFIPCFNYYMAEGKTIVETISICSIACGIAESTARAALLEYLGWGAAEGGGFLAAEAFGATGAAALGLAALALVAIGLSVHDLIKGTSGPTQQPATIPAGCRGGSYDPSENITGWSVPVLYPGCAGAWDHAQDNAQAICDAHLTCSGTCANGKPCKAVAILIDRVDETRYIVTCKAEGKFTCQCGCQ